MRERQRRACSLGSWFLVLANLGTSGPAASSLFIWFLALVNLGTSGRRSEVAASHTRQHQAGADHFQPREGAVTGRRRGEAWKVGELEGTKSTIEHHHRQSRKEGRL